MLAPLALGAALAAALALALANDPQPAPAPVSPPVSPGTKPEEAAPPGVAAQAVEEPPPGPAPVLRPPAVASPPSASAPLASPPPPVITPPPSAADPLPPFELTSASGAHRLRLGATVQLRAVYSYGLPESPTAPTAEIRRLRPLARLSLFHGRVEALLQLNTVPGTLEIVDAYVGFRLHPQVQLRVGQGKVPFTRYRQLFYSQLLMADWPLTARYFGAEHQLGLQVSNVQERARRLEYIVGLYTGTNARRGFGIGVPLVLGEKLPDPSDLAGAALPMRIHPELFVQGRLSAPGLRTDRDSDSERGPLRPSLALSAAWDMDPDPLQDFAVRLALEGLLMGRGLSLMGVLYGGFFRRNEWADIRPAALGLTTQIGYRPVPAWEVGAQYSYVGLHGDLLAVALARGKGGSLQAEHELLLGANHYLIGTSLKVQLDGAWLHHQRDPASTDELRLRLQLQAGF